MCHPLVMVALTIRFLKIGYRFCLKNGNRYNTSINIDGFGGTTPRDLTFMINFMGTHKALYGIIDVLSMMACSTRPHNTALT